MVRALPLFATGRRLHAAMKSPERYRGIEYTVIELGDRRWSWLLRPREAAILLGHSPSGQVMGTRAEAVSAATRAIHRELKSKTI
jgi:hypothetical protein